MPPMLNMKITNRSALKSFNKYAEYCVRKSGINHGKLEVRFYLYYDEGGHSWGRAGVVPRYVNGEYHPILRISIGFYYSCGLGFIFDLRRTMWHEIGHFVDYARTKGKHWNIWRSRKKLEPELPWELRPEEVYAKRYAKHHIEHASLEEQDLLLNIALEFESIKRRRDERSHLS